MTENFEGPSHQIDGVQREPLPEEGGNKWVTIMVVLLGDELMDDSMWKVVDGLERPASQDVGRSKSCTRASNVSRHKV